MEVEDGGPLVQATLILKTGAPGVVMRNAIYLWKADE
jgi:hypothetical protein